MPSSHVWPCICFIHRISVCQEQQLAIVMQGSFSNKGCPLSDFLNPLNIASNLHSRSCSKAEALFYLKPSFFLRTFTCRIYIKSILQLAVSMQPFKIWNLRSSHISRSEHHLPYQDKEDFLFDTSLMKISITSMHVIKEPHSHPFPEN